MIFIGILLYSNGLCECCVCLPCVAEVCLYFIIQLLVLLSLSICISFLGIYRLQMCMYNCFLDYIKGMSCLVKCRLNSSHSVKYFLHIANIKCYDSVVETKTKHCLG